MCFFHGLLFARWTTNETFRLQKMKKGIFRLLNEGSLFICCTTRSVVEFVE